MELLVLQFIILLMILLLKTRAMFQIYRDIEEEGVEFAGNKNDSCSFCINCHLLTTIGVEEIEVEEITDNKGRYSSVR
ncbi:uncharacterized protein LOC143894763 isoform X2 [Temnothorax americanus]|uniref:uncharacterized protein LOC143894763 isoform X2 n=1 Tax=Temnothorax americanus TaxID=1964332 RepID=UPI00406918C6